MDATQPPGPRTGLSELHRDGVGGVPDRVPTYTEIFRFAGPLMVGLMTTALVTFIDTLFIGHLGTAPLAAVPLAAMVYIIGWILLIGVMRNAIAFVARAFGAGREGEIGRIVAHYQVLAVAGLPLLGAYIQSWPLFSALAALAPAVDAHGWTYLSIRVWDVPFSMLLVLYSSFYQSLGNSRFPMLVSVGVLAANTVLDYGLILGGFGLPALGVAGSALATVCAQGFGAAVIVAVAHLSGTRRRFRLRAWYPVSLPLLRDILRIGLPQGLGDCLEVGAWVSFTLIVGRLGEVSLAANNIGIQVTHLMFLPGFALGVAASSYIGRLLGARRPDLAGRTVVRCLVVGVGYMALLGVPLWFYGAGIARLFSEDPAVVYQAALMFKVMALYQAFDGLGFITRTALGGAGDTRVPTLLLAACILFVLLPASLGLSHVVRRGLIGAWLGAFAYMAALAVAMVWRFHSGRWRDIRLSEGAAAVAPLRAPEVVH